MEPPPNKKVYYCSFERCASFFDRPYKLAQHFLAHNNVRPYPCTQPNCGKAYTSKSHLDRHLRSVHLPKEDHIVHSCPQCLKPFANRQNLKRHLNTVHKSSFTCDICKMQFKKKNQLKSHMYDHTGIKAFKCDQCNDTFVSLYLKKRHMKYHKMYKCEECEIEFNHWSKYQKHKKTDHVNSDYPHQVKSWKSLMLSNVTVTQPKFSLWTPGGAVLRSMQSPSAGDDAEVYICNECQRQFKKRTHIMRHLKTHGKRKITKTFPCPYENCQRFYTKNSNLKQHILVKHMKVFHECMLCHAQLSSKAKLNYHVQCHYKSGLIPTPINSSRKPRKDEGTFKTSTALKLSGLSKEPEDVDVPEKCIETSESPVKSVQSELITVEVDVHV